MFEREGLKTMLNTETNTSKMLTRIKSAFQASNLYDTLALYQYDFEHGQWWITELGTGRQWSVVDAIGGQSIYGFDFELVSAGDGD
jgi:hypothetical protein